ncbi:UNVERIFIED_CONTAM: putative disease resistance RPP8-like protein 2 [Sesamum indicum]
MVDLKEHIDQLAELIPDEPEKDLEEDPMEYQSLNLDVSGVPMLPNTIHKLRRLRHLSLPTQHCVKGDGKLKLQGLNELETIKWFSSWVDDITHLLKLPKLQHLRAFICNEESLLMIVDYALNHQEQFREIQLVIEDGISLENDGSSSSLLTKVLRIHSLCLLSIWCRVGKLPAYEIELCQNLLTLNLEGCYIKEDPMKILEKLPVLTSLRFQSHAYVGRKMVCSASGFPKLTELTLSSLRNLEEWRVEERAMPNLSRLIIQVCVKLKMIPEGLKFITTLKQLAIGDMPNKFNDRLQVVDGKEGEDYYKIKHIPSILL